LDTPLFPAKVSLPLGISTRTTGGSLKKRDVFSSILGPLINLEP